MSMSTNINTAMTSMSMLTPMSTNMFTNTVVDQTHITISIAKAS